METLKMTAHISIAIIGARKTTLYKFCESNNICLLTAKSLQLNANDLQSRSLKWDFTVFIDGRVT